MQPTAVAARPWLTPEDQRGLVALARQTLIDYLRDARLPRCNAPPPAWLAQRAVFVTLRRRDSGELRGCRGEIVAHFPLWEAVVQMTVASATDDPRFEPVNWRRRRCCTLRSAC